MSVSTASAPGGISSTRPAAVTVPPVAALMSVVPPSELEATSPLVAASFPAVPVVPAPPSLPAVPVAPAPPPAVPVAPPPPAPAFPVLVLLLLPQAEAKRTIVRRMGRSGLVIEWAPWWARRLRGELRPRKRYGIPHFL